MQSRQLRSSTWKRFLIIGSVGLLFVQVMTALPMLHSVPVRLVSLLSVFVGAGALAVGIKRNRPPRRIPWLLILTALLVNASAAFVDAYIHGAGNEAFPNYADIVWFSSYVPLITGFFLLSRYRTPGRDVAGLIDSTIIALGFGLLTWVLIIEPYVNMAGISTLTRVASVGYPMCDVATLWMLLKLATTPGSRSTPVLLMTAAVSCFVMSDTLLATLSLYGDFTDTNIRWIMLVAIPGFVCYGAAGLHPEMTTVTNRSSSTSPGSVTTRLVLIALAALLAPATLLYQSVRGHITDAGTISAVAGVMFLLVIARLAGMIRQQRDTNHRLDESLRKLQQVDDELRHSQKLRSIGQLAGGLAHEINTPIQAMGGNLSFLDDAFTQLDEIAEKQERSDRDRDDLAFLKQEVPRAIREATEDVGRVGAIVAAMKAFGQHEGTDFRSVDINEVVANALVVTKGTYADRIGVGANLAELPAVRCIPGDIGQVVLNLLTNAQHSIVDKGEPDGRITVTTWLDDDHAVISVSDNGTGIGPEIRDRIFEPFFTTRPVGQGTGQGLALSWALVVERHKGSISFQTTLGEGSTFTVRIPLDGPRDAGATGDRSPSDLTTAS